ncbi:helix-turn-helix transcriptional regulator [Nocardioidaceae bacterium SCSIO 66511]|nr:helix-turn-helix transcriptional regulator [Nocardioidaceae bacterium SCSIO 66511]
MLDDRGEVPRPDPHCPVEVALAAVSGRWTTLLLRELMIRPHSYSELRTALPTLSDKVLTDRLRQLRALALVDRDVHRGYPSRTRYSLTPAGQSLGPLLVELYRTGSKIAELRDDIA